MIFGDIFPNMKQINYDEAIVFSKNISICFGFYNTCQMIVLRRWGIFAEYADREMLGLKHTPTSTTSFLSRMESGDERVAQVHLTNNSLFKRSAASITWFHYSLSVCVE